ncbi:MAG: CHAD domain-containing protein [Solirubrobacterales bacterium]|nr:CHAD domain-containing protein [Solirubrobacterales bacterium]
MTPDFPSTPMSPTARRTLEPVAAQGSRAYRLRRDESAGEGLRRILDARLDDALEQLHQRFDHEPAPAVHEARKDLKKSRAVLRLARDGLDTQRYRLENGRLRDAGRALSDARDAEVRIRTIEGLREHYRDRHPEAGQALDAEVAAVRHGANGAGSAVALNEARQRSAALIEGSRDSIAELELGGGWKLVRGGLERGYRRGREGYRRAAAAEPDTVEMHEWRKRVKDLWYHLRLLRESWPPVVGALADQAGRLGELLGNHHDLATRAAELRSRPARGGDAASVLELLELRQGELLAEALPLGAALYGEKPGAFERRMHAYWRAWR